MTPDPTQVMLDEAIDQAQQQSAAVPIMPLPLAFAINQVPTPDGQIAVALQVQTPLGTFVFVVDAAGARKMGADLSKAGSASLSGLVVPGGG